jgi:hypothetical protein
MSEFELPEWAEDEQGNNLFHEAFAAGAIASCLRFKSSAVTYLRKKNELSNIDTVREVPFPGDSI